MLRNQQITMQKSSLTGPRLEADALSISQQKNIASLVELVLVLGILPNLIPGVGIPPGKRSQFLQHVIEVSFNFLLINAAESAFELIKC